MELTAVKTLLHRLIAAFYCRSLRFTVLKGEKMLRAATILVPAGYPIGRIAG